jgi:CRISPR-associated protein Cmr3
MNAHDIPKANQPDDPTLGFSISHYSLLLNGNPHLPAPADYVLHDNMLHALSLKENNADEILSSLELPYYLWTDRDGKVASPDGRWISVDSLRSYLSDAPKTLESVKLSDYYEREAHVGIARSLQTRTVEKSMLYNVNMIRVKDLKFAIEVDTNGKELHESGLLRLGSHNKTARYNCESFDTNIPAQIGTVFKLYLATPAIFKLGWKPDIEDLYGLELLAAAVGGYESIGGYDMKANMPKPMRRAAKAGSVYYYKILNDTSEQRTKIHERLHGKSISEERSNEGFGISFIGNMKGEI